MAGRRVLVTRPQPGAANTARRLQDMGFSPVILPLSQIRALPASPADVPNAIDAVAITSVNAVRHAPHDLIARLAGHRSFAVGTKTAAAAREAGFSSITEGPGDAAGLAEMVVRREKPDAFIAYLTGRVRLPKFEARLAQAGIRIATIETYDTTEVSYSDAELSGVFGDRPIEAILLYSAKAAEAVAMISGRRQWDFHFAETRYFCLSSRISAKLHGVCSEKVSVAAEPAEDALLALLESTF